MTTTYIEIDSGDIVVELTETVLALSGATTFLGLTDTPSSYSGQASKTVKVKADESGLEFITVSGGGGGGDVTKVGTPANNQIGVWTGDGTIEGDADFTFDTATDTVTIAASGKVNFGAVNILSDAAGTTTLANIDALDATTEATVEAAIDTLANLTSVQGLAVTLADAGADAVLGWDDSANAYENLTASEVLEIIKTVDGAGSGLDADLLDGISSASFVQTSSLPLSVANGGTGQTTEAEALGEMTQALTEDTTPDFLADYLATYDASADTGKKVKLSTATRIRLTGNTTYYVRTDGSDSNDGTANTAGSAWLTPQGAFNYILRNIDLRGYVLTVQVGDGTYTAASGTSILNFTGNWTGGGTLKFLGNSGDRTAVKFSASGSQAHAVCTDLQGVTAGTKAGDIYIQDIQLISGNAYAVAHGGVGDLFITNCDVSAAFAHFVSGLFSRLFVLGTFTILSGAQFHFQANDMSYIGYFPTAINTTSVRNFSVAFAGCFLNSFVDYFPVSISGSGVTGKKYYLTMNSCINAISTAISSFPGDSTGTNEQGYLQTTAGVWHGIPNGYGFHDDAENEQLLFAKTASAVNYWQVTNASTGNSQKLTALGDDTDINADIVPKGTGVLRQNTTPVALTGKQTIWVPASAMTPRTTSGAEATTRETNGITMSLLAFDTAADEGANFHVAFPKSWNAGTVTYQAFWTAASSTGTVEFELRGGCFANDAAVNTSGLGTAVAVSDTLLATNDVHVTSESSAVTLSNAADDTLAFFELIRDVSDDTLGADAELIGIKFFYTTDVGNDA